MIAIDKIKSLLIKQQKRVEEEIKSLKKEDPLKDSALIAESSEPGNDSWVADTHSRIMAITGNLQKALGNIKIALFRINTGKYGQCEKCGKQIEEKRLEAMPTATLCISCSKKK